MTIEPAIIAPSPRGKRSLRGRILAAALSTIAACVLSEVGLRVLGYSRTYLNPCGSFHEHDPILGCRGKPNFRGRFCQRDFDVVVVHNELGFRRSEEGRTLSSPRHDVFVLGDSFVWGFGVGQREIVTDRMRVLLPGYRVHNFGLTGSGTVEQYKIFRTLVAPRLHPGDTVVLAVFGNDFGDNVGRYMSDRLHATIEGGEIREVPPLEESLLWTAKNKLKDVSYLINLAAYTFSRLKHSGLESRQTSPSAHRLPSADELEALSSEESPSVRIMRFYLGEFQKACDEARVRLVVAYIPGQAELGENDLSFTEDLSVPEQRAVRATLFRCTESLGIRTVDLLPCLLKAKSEGQNERLTFRFDFHWNANGHAAAARVLSEWILTNDQS